MAALQSCQAILHDRTIELRGNMDTIEAAMGWLDFAGVEHVLVPFAGGREAGMKVRIHPGGLQYPDGSGQHRIEAAQKKCAGQGGAGGKMGDHRFCMDSGVGPAGTMQMDFFTAHQGEATLHLPLDRPVMALALPTAELAAVIGNKQTDMVQAGQHRRRISGNGAGLKEKLGRSVSR